MHYVNHDSYSEDGLLQNVWMNVGKSKASLCVFRDYHNNIFGFALSIDRVFCELTVYIALANAVNIIHGWCMLINEYGI